MKRTRSESTNSKISSVKIMKVIDKLMSNQTRKSTGKTYLRVWRQFNNFVINLDVKPKYWEDRTTLFIGHLVDKGVKSNSIKTYVSAIKRILIDDGYQWEDSKILLSSLTRACRIINDKVHTRLPIQCGLLELVLFEIQRTYSNQFYLEKLYKAIFALSYYGLMRVSEVVLSDEDSYHAVRASNIHVATNKDKILIVLYTSKTHGKDRRPQKIKIVSNKDEKSGQYLHRNFCPFTLTKEYLAVRGDYSDDNEQFFIFRDGSVVTASHARCVLKSALKELGLNSALYGMHSFWVGRTSDLIKYNYSIEEVQRMGRWRSNVVFNYIRS